MPTLAEIYSMLEEFAGDCRDPLTIRYDRVTEDFLAEFITNMSSVEVDVTIESFSGAGESPDSSSLPDLSEVSRLLGKGDLHYITLLLTTRTPDKITIGFYVEKGALEITIPILTGTIFEKAMKVVEMVYKENFVVTIPKANDLHLSGKNRSRLSDEIGSYLLNQEPILHH